jgi:hypothetical protein
MAAATGSVSGSGTAMAGAFAAFASAADAGTVHVHRKVDLSMHVLRIRPEKTAFSSDLLVNVYVGSKVGQFKMRPPVRIAA